MVLRTCLILAMCSGITPGGALGIIGGARDQTSISHVRQAPCPYNYLFGPIVTFVNYKRSLRTCLIFYTVICNCIHL